MSHTGSLYGINALLWNFITYRAQMNWFRVYCYGRENCWVEPHMHSVKDLSLDKRVL